MAKEKKQERFVTVYSRDGFSTGEKIVVDRLTGVNYLVISTDLGGGITPLLGSDGKPIVTPLAEFDEK